MPDKVSLIARIGLLLAVLPWLFLMVSGVSAGLFVEIRFDGIGIPSGDLVAQENLQYVLRLALDVHWFVVAGEGITWHRSVELPVRYLPKTRTLPEGKGMLVALILETGHRPPAKR